MRMRDHFNAGSKMLAAALLFASAASAGTIFATDTVFGNMPSFAVSGSNSTSASQFDETATNASIQAGCPVGYTCSALTLNEIDFTLTGNTSGSVTVDNGNGSTSYVSNITGLKGTFISGSAGAANTTGTAVQQVTTINLVDPLSNTVTTVLPTVNVATTNEWKTTCGTTGSMTSSNFVTCLTLSPGSHVFTGNGTDTQTGSYLSGDLTGPVLAAYVGTGSVSFNLGATGSTNNGSLPSNVTIPGNSATVLALSNALQIDYQYSYTETLNVIPEPATFVMLGSALIGLAAVLKRRQRKA